MHPSMVVSSNGILSIEKKNGNYSSSQHTKDTNYRPLHDFIWTEPGTRIQIAHMNTVSCVDERRPKQQRLTDATIADKGPFGVE